MNLLRLPRTRYLLLLKRVSTISLMHYLFFLQSAEVYDYVKKDFDEFTQTVSEEVSTTATALKEKLKVLFLSSL